METAEDADPASAGENGKRGKQNMKKTLVLLMTAFLLLACLSGCGEKAPEKEEEVGVEITMENFREYFEFTTFANWDEYYWWLQCGWGLKKEYADRFVATPKDDPLEARIRREEGCGLYRIERDESDPSRYTVGELVDRCVGYTGQWQFEEYRDPATGETRYGFFFWTDNGAFDVDPTAFLVMTEEDFVVEDVLGSLILKAE